MEIRRYIALVRRWAWLLILGLVLGAAGGYLGSRYQTPIYQASTKVMISRVTQTAQSSDVTALLNSQQLTDTYVQLIKTKSVLNTVSQRLGTTVGAGEISASALTNTQIIQITVEDSNPQQAVLIANSVVEVLIEQNNNIQMGRYTDMEESLQAQKTQLETQIANLQSQIDQASSQTVEEQKKLFQDQISALQTEASSLQADIANIGVPTTPEQQTALNEKNARLQQIQSLLSLYQKSYDDLVVNGNPLSGSTVASNSQLALLRTTQSLYQQIYTSVLSNLESVRLASLQNTPNVVQIEQPTLPHTPVRPRTQMNTLLAGAVGLMIAAAGVFIKEYLDDTLKTSEEVEQYTGLPIIGYIAEIQTENGKEEGLYVAQQPRSPVSEAFRSLRTNLEFTGVDKPLKTIIVTSPGPGEGKTTIAVNLAGIISQGGKRVVLLDTDLRRPRVHRILGIPNRVGLSDVFRGHLGLQDVMQPVEDAKGMSVITSGSLPPNPSELLGSAKMLQILEELKSQTDIVVIDSPPSLVTDAQVMASKVDGVLMIIWPGHTHRDSAKATIEQLKRAEANVVGAVFNRIPRDRSGYYGGHYYYYSHYDKSYHYYSEEGRKAKKKKK